MSSAGSGTTSDRPGTSGNGSSADVTGSGSSGPGGPCDYPAGAVDPMAIDEVLWPYRWPTAIHGDGTQVALDLAEAPCGFDQIIEWSPHDVLLFVSIPAW